VNSNSNDQLDAVNVTQVLSQSYTELTNASFRFRGTISVGVLGGVEAEGIFSAADQVGEMSTNFMGQEVQIRIIGEDFYVNGFLEEDDTWVRLDLSQMAEEETLSRLANPIVSANYLLAVAEAEEVSDGRYEGTIDLVEFVEQYASEEERAYLANVPEEFTAVPFEATVDDEGRLTSLRMTLTLDFEGGTTEVIQEVEFSDFGIPVEVETPPADQVIEAPAGLYGQ